MGLANSGWRKSLDQQIDHTRGDVVLLLCYIVTGLLDSASSQGWNAFVSMQTGNTVFVGLGIASAAYPPVNIRLYRSGISLLSFCVGCFIFARFHRYFSPKRRWVLCASFCIQTILIIIAACIVTFISQPDATSSSAWDYRVLVPLALISFQSSGQAVTSRALKCNGLTSVVLTSIYCDLFMDPDIFGVRNVERNRRALAPLLLLIGAIAGGVFVHSWIGIMGALWLAAFMKAVMTSAWFFWPAESED